MKPAQTSDRALLEAVRELLTTAAEVLSMVERRLAKDHTDSASSSVVETVPEDEGWLSVSQAAELFNRPANSICWAARNYVGIGVKEGKSWKISTKGLREHFSSKKRK